MEKKLLKEFKFNAQRYVRNTIVFLVVAFAIFYFAGFMNDLAAWLLPFSFVASIAFASGVYAWTTRDRDSVCVYDRGLRLGASYIPWGDVEDVSLNRVDIDTISYTLSVLLKDKSKLERDVNFFQESATDVFQFVNQTFRRFKGEA